MSSRRLTSSAPWYAQSTKDRTDLLGKGSNVDPIADTCHKIWAEVQLSLRDARSFHTVLATALNLDQGPGETGTWMGRARTASNKSCPLFQSQVDKIRKDYSCCCVSPEDDDWRGVVRCLWGLRFDEGRENWSDELVPIRRVRAQLPADVEDEDRRPHLLPAIPSV